MEVRLAEKHGFCPGVESAIERAEQIVSRGATGNVYSLGEVIHNRQVVDGLAERGLRVLEDSAQAHEGDVVLLRSHGVPPEVVQTLTARGATVVDATCVLVKKAQTIVAQLHEEGYRVVVIGDRNHPEVRGIVGYAPRVICVGSPADLDRLPPTGRLGIVAQTTQSLERFGEMVGRIAAMGYRELKVVNTLCPETRRRQEAAVELAAQVDVMFVLGGRQSANTRELAELCRKVGAVTHHLESWDDFDPAMVAAKQVAGVTAGASTPKWIVQRFVENLRAL